MFTTLFSTANSIFFIVYSLHSIVSCYTCLSRFFWSRGRLEGSSRALLYSCILNYVYYYCKWMKRKWNLLPGGICLYVCMYMSKAWLWLLTCAWSLRDGCVRGRQSRARESLDRVWCLSVCGVWLSRNCRYSRIYIYFHKTVFDISCDKQVQRENKITKRGDQLPLHNLQHNNITESTANRSGGRR